MRKKLSTVSTKLTNDTYKKLNNTMHNDNQTSINGTAH